MDVQTRWNSVVLASEATLLARKVLSTIAQENKEDHDWVKQIKQEMANLLKNITLKFSRLRFYVKNHGLAVLLTSFSTFSAALQTARLVEENIQARRPTAATPVLAAVTDTPSQPPDWLLAMISALKPRHGPFRPPKPQRTRPYDRQPQGPRPSARPDPQAQPTLPALPTTAAFQCTFCGLSNHAVMECHKKQRLNESRRRAGLPMLTISTATP